MTRNPFILFSILAVAIVLGSRSDCCAQQSAGCGVNQDSVLNDSLPIAPGDIVNLHFLNESDMDQSRLRVSDGGEVPLLLLGNVKIGGQTQGQASETIAKAYVDRHFLRSANISLTVEHYASSSVNVIGFINGTTPTSGTGGVNIPLTTPKSLLAVLSSAGGLSDRASRTITIERQGQKETPIRVFLPNNPDAQIEHDLLICPGDTVIVPRAGLVYILGDVAHASAVVMSEDGRLSLLEALSQAGSPNPSAGLRRVMVFKKTSGTYVSQPVNVGKILKGSAHDIELGPEDVIWVPFSYGKNILVNSAGIAASIGSATASGLIYVH